jgi:hypothetical protein
LLLAKRQPFQNGAEFYSNGCCFVKHHRKLKPASLCRNVRNFAPGADYRLIRKKMLVFNRLGIFWMNHRHRCEPVTRCAALAVNAAECGRLAAARE